jgi:methanogenic corrinoid protein MtbC1
MKNSDPIWIPILQVERETGISREALRKWEMRYGFPIPQRHDNGDRLYSESDLRRLRIIKGLMDGGHRPGKLVSLSMEELIQIQRSRSFVSLPAPVDELAKRIICRLHDGDVQALTYELETALLTQGLNTFVETTLPPLINHIGDQWGDGNLAIHQEHLFSEVLRSILQHSALRLRGYQTGLRVLMGTAPEELHGMGLTMLQAVLSLAGVQCINLGTQVPKSELVKSACSYRADIVAISFSLSYPSRRIGSFITDLRLSLPESIHLWVGGAGVDRLHSHWANVKRFRTLGEAVMAVATFRTDAEIE